MKSSVRASISAEVRIVLTEEEARALVGITVYGPDQFLRCFFEHLGRYYLGDHIEGLRSLFASVGPIEHELKRIDKAREEFKKQ